MQKSSRNDRRATTSERPKNFFITTGLIVVLLIFFYKYWNISTHLNQILNENLSYKSLKLQMERAANKCVLDIETLKSNVRDCKSSLNDRENLDGQHLKELADSKILLSQTENELKTCQNEKNSETLNSCDEVKEQLDKCLLDQSALELQTTKFTTYTSDSPFKNSPEDPNAKDYNSVVDDNHPIGNNNQPKVNGKDPRLKNKGAGMIGNNLEDNNKDLVDNKDQKDGAISNKVSEEKTNNAGLKVTQVEITDDVPHYDYNKIAVEKEEYVSPEEDFVVKKKMDGDEEGADTSGKLPSKGPRRKVVVPLVEGSRHQAAAEDKVESSQKLTNKLDDLKNTKDAANNDGMDANEDVEVRRVIGKNTKKIKSHEDADDGNDAGNIREPKKTLGSVEGNQSDAQKNHEINEDNKPIFDNKNPIKDRHVMKRGNEDNNPIFDNKNPIKDRHVMKRDNEDNNPIPVKNPSENRQAMKEIDELNNLNSIKKPLENSQALKDDKEKDNNIPNKEPSKGRHAMKDGNDDRYHIPIKKSLRNHHSLKKDKTNDNHSPVRAHPEINNSLSTNNNEKAKNIRQPRDDLKPVDDNLNNEESEPRKQLHRQKSLGHKNSRQVRHPDTGRLKEPVVDTDGLKDQGADADNLKGQEVNTVDVRDGKPGFAKPIASPETEEETLNGELVLKGNGNEYER